MQRFAVVVLLGLTACATSDSTTADTVPIAIKGWRMASGQVPTQAEFNAIVASCQDRRGALDPCLSDLGLRRAR